MYFSLSFDGINLTTDNSLDIISNPHVTLAYKPNDEQIAALSPYLNKEIECEIIGYANDGLNEGYEVRLPDNLPYFNKATPHITISTSKKSKPVKTGYMNFQSIDKTFTLKGKVILVQW